MSLPVQNYAYALNMVENMSDEQLLGVWDALHHIEVCWTDPGPNGCETWDDWAAMIYSEKDKRGLK